MIYIHTVIIRFCMFVKHTVEPHVLKFYVFLKGVFAKNERGYRLNAKNKRF